MELEKLNSPIRPEEVEWRVSSQTKDGLKLLIVPYVTNRCVMQRFDEQFGWDGWENSLDEIDGGFICTLTVNIDGRRISKSDGASRTNVEPVKGGISDAMKRCAVQFGLGRGLYNYPKVYLETTEKYIPNWAERLLDALVTKINQAKPVRPVVILKESDAKNLQAA